MKVHGSYKDDGYAHVERLIAPEIAQVFVSRMERDFTASNLSFAHFEQTGPLMAKSTVEVPGHAYSPMNAFLWGLTPIMCELTGRDLLPSYGYFRIYQQGDICRVHVDRPACEHSLSLTLGYSDNQPWALDISSERDDTLKPLRDDFGTEPHRSLVMMPGDGVLYQGVHHAHGRVKPNPNTWSAHLFLHWVDSGGPYRDHAFDAVKLAAAAKAQETGV